MPAANTSSLALLRPRIILLISLLAGTPFLLTYIPPLTDVPGHIGRLSVQTASVGDRLLKFFSFHWELTLNLASDILVQVFRKISSPVTTVRIICALTPMITTFGILSIARTMNRHGAHAVPWALAFVFNFPFLWGFLNFSLTMALGLVSVAAWAGLSSQRRLRAILFTVIIPLLFIGHGVAGLVTVGIIVTNDAWYNKFHGVHNGDRWLQQSIVNTWPIIFVGAITLVLWRYLGSSSNSGDTVWLMKHKPAAIIYMLRDQSKFIDISSIVCCMIILALAWRWGARLKGGSAGIIVFLVVLFTISPTGISGSTEIDTRLAPLIPMMAFALLDWSDVEIKKRAIVYHLGVLFTVLRFSVVFYSFYQYSERYDKELAALSYIPLNARVLNLSQFNCDAPGERAWRSARLEHLADLATTFRESWVNAHWSIDGLHLLTVDYRPSPEYYKDPSHLIWAPNCVSIRKDARLRNQPTLIDVFPKLPLSRVDYLWLINTHLPDKYRASTLKMVWRDDISELYQTHVNGKLPHK